MSIHAVHSVEASLLGAWPPAEWKEIHVVLAVSGGADSVALLRAMSAIKRQLGGAGKLFVAHLNHHLRGNESDGDEAWLADLCQNLHLPLEVGHAEVADIAAAAGDGMETAARLARYEFLTACAERLGARVVVTAHTYDDQVETVLHRILRGTGLAGARGILAWRQLTPSVVLRRPLLGIRRQEILAYLRHVGQDFREDATNLDRRFTRNRLRHELLPKLRSEFNSDVDAALVRLAKQCGEAQEIIGQQAALLCEECVASEEGTPLAHSSPARQGESGGEWRGLVFRIAPLTEQPPIIVREVFKRAWQAAGWPLQSMGFDHWQRLAGLVLGSGAEGRPCSSAAGETTSPAEVSDAANSLTFPGEVQAFCEAGRIVLRRGTR